MSVAVLAALLLSAALYLYMGFRERLNVRSLGDLLPVVSGKNARVATTDEFASSTVATTVSLATIIVAYFELAGYFGLWLLWTVVTTALGMVLVSVVAKRIWTRLNAYSHRPSLHEFLGTEYESPRLAFIASLCTTVGFLLIFATELIVGSRFIAGLVPQIPAWLTVIGLSAVGFGYTWLGGFRSVIKTDQVQMKMIWGLIVALGVYYIYFFSTHGGVQPNVAKVPAGVLDFSNRPGLFWFLVGITIMNVPTHISNMAIWQRIGGADNVDVVSKGIRSSIFGIAASWGLIVMLAVLAYAIVQPESGKTLLVDVMREASTRPLGLAVVFVVALGLLGAMLSTASTLLIVITHTISEDLVAKLRRQSVDERVSSEEAFRSSRLILLGAAIGAVALVQGLEAIGFSVADLVFAIYGGALSLFPPILLALFKGRERLASLSAWATSAVALGFAAGWGAAFIGKAIENSNLVFLSPAYGIGASALVLLLGTVLTGRAKGAS